ncbi:MAG: DUF1835 domain-containing protein [Kofleriaceae bacterium]
MTERIVHLCNGDATADVLSLADLPGDLRVWADALDQGPLKLVEPADFRSSRASFAARAGWSEGEDAALAKLTAWDRNLEWDGAEEVVLWYEHDLFDQLALCRILFLWSSAEASRDGGGPQVTIVSIDRHPEVPQFLGLGQLAPEQLAQLWPRRTPVAREAIEEAVATWIALTSPDPRALPYLMKRVKALPFLAGAIERHLEEFPDVASGLGRSERQVLASVGRGASDAAVIAAEVHAIDPRYPLTDLQLGVVLNSLVSGGLASAPARPASLRDPWRGLEITSLGRQALAGAVDIVSEVGIDRWRGGVALCGRGPTWRWDSPNRRLSWR